MKKTLFIAVLAIGALVSCSENDFVGESPSTSSNNEVGAINFGSGLRAITRADLTGSAAAAELGNNFVVEGFKWDGGSSDKEVVFDHYNVYWGDNTANTTTSNTANWEYVGQKKHQYGPAGDQTIKYWDYAKSQYDFIAWSAGSATAIYTGTPNTGQVLISEIIPATMNGTDTNNNGKIDENEGAYTIKGNADDLAKVYIADLVTIYRGEVSNNAAGNYGKEVDIKFRSLSAKVRIGLYEIVPGYSVKDVVFYTDATTKDTPTYPATWGNAHLFTTGSDVFNGAGTYIVYYPTTGADKAPGGANQSTDYNKAHLQFVAAETDGTSKVMEFGALKGSLAVEQLAAAEKAEATGNLYLGRSSNTAIYAGAQANNYYKVVIPNETGATLNLKVDYTLVSTDGDGETIKVTGATAQVPAAYAKWKSGYAYTYLFKISQNGNGYTNPDPTIGPAGLYPITFDAVVVDSEADGVQETITTVAEPSITTYSKGTIVTANNEYVSGNKIYVVVEYNGSVVDLTDTNAKLYTVTLTDGDNTDDIKTAAQTINEASVANALAQGGSVIDKNKFILAVTPVSDGTLTYPEKIVAAESPDGNEINVDCALFTAGAAGTTYVFQYVNTNAVTYKQAEANTYNAGLAGAITTGAGFTFTSYGQDKTTEYGTGKVKQLSQVGEWTTVLVTSNSVEGFVGKEYKVHATALDTNTFYELYTTEGAATGIYVKVQNYTYVDTDVNTYNATLPGAVKEGDVKTPGVYGYKIIKIAK